MEELKDLGSTLTFLALVARSPGVGVFLIDVFEIDLLYSGFESLEEEELNSRRCN